MTSTVPSADGTTIAFDRLGDGPPLVLVGGAFQYRAADPRTTRLAELLASSFTVVHYDRRGRGESTDTPPYAVEREVEDLDALIGEVGGSAYAFGMSSGAVLALDAARTLAISRLALYEPPFVIDDTRPPVPADYRARLAALLADGRRGDAVELFLTVAVGVPAEYVAPMRAEPFWGAFEAVAPTLAYDAAIMGDTMAGRPLPADRWADVTQPTLVMGGGDSDAYQQHAVSALAALLPVATARTLAGQTHLVAPETLAPELASFFSDEQPRQ